MFKLKMILVVAACLLGLTAVNATNLVVETTNGQVEGFLDATNNVRLFQGIPYAKPPVNELRFEYPLPPTKYASTYKATFQAPGCPQDCVLPPGNCPEKTSEDCLYLTVFAPTEPPKDKSGYPVLFWIHGGAYEQGLGQCALYNGTTFAHQGIMTIAINYRLGALGFMASKSMKGNYGLLDQRLAMQWARDNVAAFGGDPDKITLAGQSAGAMSVGSHLISSGSQGLFSKAIMESNPLGMPYHTRESAQTNADAVFKYLGCASEDVACMRGKTADEIVKAQKEAIAVDRKTLFINFLPFAPMIEKGGELPDQPLTAMTNGQMAKMPILAGNMLDEGQLFVYELFTKPMSKTSYHATLDAVFGMHTSKKIKDAYPLDCEGCPADNKDGRNSFNVLATDLLFYCPLRNMTRGYQATLGVNTFPTYHYRFKHVLTFDCWGPMYPFCVGTVCHGSELPFVFNVFGDGVTQYNPTSSETQLAKDLGSAWANFMFSADPNPTAGSSLVVPQSYVKYDGTTDTNVILDEPQYSDQSHVRSSFCDMWDGLGYLNW